MSGSNTPLESAGLPESDFHVGESREDASGPRAGRFLSVIEPLGVPFVALLLIVVFSISAPSFLSAGNFGDIAKDSALPSIVAVGLTAVLVMSEYDLSIAAVSSFATTMSAVLWANDGVPLVVGILAVVAASIAIGAFNGTLVAYFGVTALIVTIAAGSILNGGEYLISHSAEISSGFPQGFVNFTRGDILHINSLVVIAIVVAVAGWVVLERTPLGRNMRAIGGNAEAARLAGVNVRRTRVIGFAISSGLSGLSGILYAGQQGVAYPLTGLNVLLPSFAAAFIGAAAIKVGRFNVIGTILGVLIAEITATGLLLLDVPNYATYIFQGGILVFALLFARLVGSRTR